MTTTLTTTGDTYLKSGSANQSQGVETILSIQSSGKNRSLVQFDQAAIASTVGAGTLQSATLELYIEFNSDSWGTTGRTVDAHRLTAPWTEAGATWNCGNDTIPSNSAADCSPQWNGGIFNATPTATLLHTNGLAGWIQFNVTADVQAFLAGTADYGWLIKKTDEGQTGQVNYASRQGTAGRAPRLVLTVAVPDTVPPVIAVTEPRDAHIYNDSTPAVVLTYSDDNSGIALDSLHTYMDGAEFTASCAKGTSSASCESPALTAGTHTITATIADNAGHPASTSFAFTLHLDVTQHAVTFHATEDTYLRGGSPNQNQGTETILQIQSSGPNRALVQFDAQDLQSAIGDGTVVSAELQLYIEHNVDNWGDGRAVDAHRVTVPWTDRGATWNCPDDTDPSNQQADCVATWDGGAYNPTPTGTVLHTNGLMGWVSFDVTADVDAFAHGTPDHGWLIRKTEEGQNGQVHYTAREGLCANQARLVVTVLRSSSDTVAPRLEIQSPTDPYQVNDSTVDIELVFTDLWSGIAPSSLHVTMDGADLTASLSRCPDRAWGPSPALAEGEHTLTVSLSDGAGNTTTKTFTFWVLLGDGAHRVTIPVGADTFLRSGAPNQNQGAETFLRVRESGDNRALVRVDQDAIAAVFDAGTFVKAVLELYIEDNGDNWGPSGRTLDVHRMISPWNETGATWNCADDTDISNQQPDCDPQWDGGVYAPAPSDTLLIRSQQTGWIQFDVTADVAAFMGGVLDEGWAVRKTLENEAGLVLLTSREGAGGQHPRLILVLSTGGVVDTTPPVIHIYVGGNELADGTCYGQGITPTIVVTDQSPVTRALRLDGFAYTEGTPIAEPGEHTLVVTATDTYLNTAEVIRQFTIDSTPPVFTGIQPPPGACLTQTPLTLSGSCPECTAVTANGIGGSLAPDGAFVIAGIPLVQGTNPITLTGVDACGTTATLPLIYILDTVAPVVTITYPPAGFVSGQSLITVAGNINEAHLQSAALNGIPLAVAGGTFSAADVPLNAGPNAFTVTALDCAGNAGQAVVTVILDTQDPVIRVREGHSGEPQIVADPPYSHPVVPLIEVLDDTETTFTAHLDGQPFVSGTAVTAEGEHHLHVTAADQAGRQTTVDVIFTIDITAPPVTIVSPQPTQVQPSGTFTMTGGCGDAITVFVNGTEGVVTTPTFSAALDLEAEGDNPVHIEAFDRAGNRGVLDVVYVLDTRAPRIVVRAPAAGFVTNRAAMDVEGGIEDEPHLAPDGVTVNGLIAVVAGTNFARAGVPLAEGTAVITVTAADTLGHQATATVEGTVDLTPPQAALLANGTPLADGALFNVTVTLTAQVSDALTGATAAFQVNAQPYTEGTPLAGEGIYQVRLTAADGAGNTTVVERAFTIDKTPPAISAVQPAAGTCLTTPAVTLSGRCDDAASVTVNGAAAQVNGGAFVLADLALQEGNNALTLRAEDGAGNASTAVHTLIRDTAAPVLTLSAPADGTLTTASSVVVTGAVADAHLNRILVNSAEAPLAGNAFQSLPVALIEGENLITIEVFDCAGNTNATQSVTVIKDTQCPVLTITNPRPNETVGAAALTVSGAVADDHLREVKVGTVTATLGEGTYTAAVTLQAGANTLRVEALDTLGNMCAQEVAVTYDAQAPQIAVTSPAANALLTTPTVTVTGTVADDNLAPDGVTVNGLPAVVADGTFTKADLALTEGSNTIIARATDTYDHSTTATVRVILDTKPPTVVSTQPATGAAGVPLDYLLKITFSEMPDWTTVTSQSFILIPAAAGTITHFATAELIFRPTASLPPATTFTVQLTADIRDKAGHALTPYTFTFTTLDTQAPAPPTLTPVPSAVCQNPITVSGTAEAGALITVTGGQSAVTGSADASGAFAIEVRLREGTLNLLEVRARDAAGNTSLPAAVEITHTCAPPEVTDALLDADAAVIRVVFTKPMDAATLVIAYAPTPDPASTCTVLDPAGVLVAVTGTWDETGTLLTLALPVPELSQVVLTLRLTIGLEDRLGIPLAYPFMKMFNTTFDAFLSGVVFDDTTGLPLTGATITLTNIGEPRPSTASNGEGKYTLAAPASPSGGSHLLFYTKDDTTPAYRRDVAEARKETLVFDVRLTPRAAAFTIPVEGMTDRSLAAGTTLTVEPDAFAAAVEARITLVSPQGLPNLLPLGWSPLFGVEIILSAEPVTDAVLAMTYRAAEPLDAAHIYLVEYSLDDHQWHALEEVSLTDPSVLGAALPHSGYYALIYPDADPTNPGAVTLGAPLPGAAAPAVPLAFTAVMTLNPETVLPTQTAQCTVADVEEAEDRPIPSGYPVTARVQETLTLIGGSTLAVPPYTAALLLYREPVTDAAGTFQPALRFPVTPTPKAREVVLDVGYDHITLFPYPTEVRRGNSIGPAGDSVTSTDGVILTVPAGATDEFIPAVVESVPADGLPVPLPVGLRFLAAAEVSFGTFELAKSATLTYPFATPLGATEFPVLLALSEQNDGTYAIFHAAAEQVNEALISCEVYPTTTLATLPDHPHTPCTGLHEDGDLPLATLGIRESGVYIFAAAQVPEGLAPGLHLITGKVEDRTVAPIGSVYPVLPDHFIQSLTSPLHVLTNADGAYCITAPLRDAVLKTVKPSTGDAVQTTVDVNETEPWKYFDQDLSIQSVPPTIGSFSPAEEALDVPLTPVIEVNFSEPIAPSSVGSDAIVLKMGAAPIAGTAALAASGLKLTFTPSNALLEGTRYTFLVSGALKDLAGNALAGPRGPHSFTTIDLILPEDVDRSKISLVYIEDYYSEDDPETPKSAAKVIGEEGAVPSEVSLQIQRITPTTGDPTTGGQAGVYGDFTVILPCALNDRVVLHVKRLNQADVTLELTPFERPDGTGAWLDDRAAEFTTADDITITVEAGTFDHVVPITVTPLDPATVSFTPSPEFPAYGALDFDIGDAFARKPIHITLPQPAGSEAAQEFFVATVEEVAGEQRLMIAARLYPAADGKLTTVFPEEVPGLRSSDSDKSYYEESVLPILRQKRRLVLLGASMPTQYVVGPYPGFGNFVIDPFSNLVSYFDTLYQDLWLGAMGELRFLLAVPLGRTIQIEIRDVDTGYLHYEQTLPPGDSAVYEFNEPLPVSTEIPLTVSAEPFLLVPFDGESLYYVEQFGYDAALSEETRILTITPTLGEDEFLTVCRTSPGSLFPQPTCRSAEPYTFTDVDRDTPFLMALTRGKLGSVPHVTLHFNQAIKPEAQRVGTECEAASFLFQRNGSTAAEDTIPAFFTNMEPVEEAEEPCLYPENSAIGLAPAHPLIPGQTYDLIIKAGIEGTETAESYRYDIPLRFTVKEYAQGGTVGNFPVVKAMLRVGRLLVISALMPANTPGLPGTVESNYLLLYDLNAFFAAYPAGSFPPILSYHQLNAPVNAMKLDPQGRIIAVEGKVGNPSAIGIYEIQRQPHAGAPPTYELMRRGAAQLSYGDENTVPLDLEIHSDDDSHAYRFSPQSPTSHPFTPVGSPDVNGFFTLDLALPNDRLPDPIGKNNRITVVNKTLQMRWSKDPGGCDSNGENCSVRFVPDPLDPPPDREPILARPGDELLVLVNKGLMAFVPVLNKGLIVADLWKVDLGVQSPDFEFLYIPPDHGWNHDCETTYYSSNPYVSTKFIEKSILERTISCDEELILAKEVYLSVTAGNYEGFFRVHSGCDGDPGDVEVLERLTDFMPKCLLGHDGNMTDLLSVACDDHTARTLLSVSGAHTDLLSFKMEPDRLDVLQTKNAGPPAYAEDAEIYDALDNPEDPQDPYYVKQTFDTSLPSAIAKLAYDPVSRLLYGVLMNGGVAVFNAASLCEKGTVDLVSVIVHPPTDDGDPIGLSSISPLVLAEAGMFFGVESGGCEINPETMECFDEKRTISGGITPVRIHGPVLTAVSAGDDGQTLHAVGQVVPLGLKRPTVEGDSGPVEKGDAAFTVQTFLLQDIPAIKAEVTAINRFDESVLPAGDGFPDPSVNLDLVKLVPPLDEEGTSDLRQDANFLYATQEPVVVTADPRAQKDYDAGYNACASDPERNCVRPVWVEGPDPENPRPFKEILSGDYIKLTLHSDQPDAPSIYAGLMMREDETLNSLPAVRMEMIDSPNPESPRNPAVGGAGVFLHSGEYVTEATDLAIKGRGIDFAFNRTYNSQSIQHGPLGRGWDHHYNQRLRELPTGDVEYYDGAGHVVLFTLTPDPETPTASSYVPPPGIFLELKRDLLDKPWGIIDPQNNTLLFNEAGRLTQIRDRNAVGTDAGNRLTLAYDLKERLIAVKDDMGRVIRFRYTEPEEVGYDPEAADPVVFKEDPAYPGIGLYLGLLKEVVDFKDQKWSYRYDDTANLVATVTPDVTTGVDTHPAGGLTTTYVYGDATSAASADVLNRTSNLTAIRLPKSSNDFMTLTYNAAADTVWKEGLSGHEVSFQYEGAVTTVRDRLEHKNAYTFDGADADHRNRLTTATLDQGVFNAPLAITYAGAEADDPLYYHPATTTFPAGNGVKLIHTGDATAGAPETARRNMGTIRSISALGDGERQLAEWQYHETTNLPTEVKDGKGNLIVINRPDSTGNPDKITYPEQGPIGGNFFEMFAFDRFGLLEDRTDGDNFKVVFGYDAFGYPTEAVHQGADGPNEDDSVKFKTNPDAWGRPTGAVDGRGVEDSYEYNELGWLVKTVTGNMGTVADGENVSMALPVTTTYTYDPNGNLIETVRTALNTPERRVERRYDAYNRLTDVIEYVVPGGTIPETTHYEYDFEDHILSITRPGGIGTAYTYDGLGRVETMTRGSGNDAAVTGYAYDLNGNVEKIKGHDGGMEYIKRAIGYDGFRRVNTITDCIDRTCGTYRRTTVGEYDNNNQPTRVTVTDQTGRKLAETGYEYDALQRPSHIYEYLTDGPLAGAYTTTYLTYDHRGNVTGVTLQGTNANMSPVTQSYDFLNRLKTISDPVGNTVENGYGKGFTPKTVTQTGAVLPATTTLKQDTQGAVRAAVDQLGNKVDTTTDADGRPIEVINVGMKTKETYAYDSAGRLLAVAGGGVTGVLDTLRSYTYQFGDHSSTVSVADTAGQQTVTTYNTRGLVTSVEYPGGTEGNPRAYAYEYDADDRVTRVTDPRGMVLRNDYDVQGNLTGRFLEAYPNAPAGSPAPDPEQPIEAYTYDALGRLTDATGPGGTVHMDYDSLGQVLEESINGVTVLSEYDGLGRRTGITYPGGQYLGMQYDPAGRLWGVPGYTTGIAYDGANGLAAMSLTGEGLARETGYDALGRPLRNATEKNDVPLAGEVQGYYGNHLLAAQQSVLTGQGRQYAYDGLHQLTETAGGLAHPVISPHVPEPSLTIPSDAPSYFKLDPDAAQDIREYKERLSIDAVHQLEEIKAAHIDPATHQITAVDGIPFDHDPVGNLTRKGDLTFEYDHNDRLRKVYKNGVLLAEYLYDPLGRRIQKTVTGGGGGTGYVKKYVWSGWQVLEEYSYDGLNNMDKLQTRYVYGNGIDELIAIEKDFTGDGVLDQRYYVHQDPSGNVTALITPDGRVVETYDYAQPYGGRVEITGDTAAPTITQIRTVAAGAGKLEIQVAFSEAVLGEAAKQSIMLQDMTDPGNPTVIAGTADVAAVEGRDAYKALTFTTAAEVAVTTPLRLAVDHSRIQDLFHNALFSDVEQSFTWTGTGAVLQDGGPPELDLAVLDQGKIYLRFTEEIVPSTASDGLLFDGQPVQATLYAGNRALEFAPATLSLGNHTITIRAPLADLAGKTIATLQPGFNYAARDVLIYEKPREGATLSSATGNTILFQGREYDAETGLYYFRHRYYDPELGRFTQTDPMGYADSMNLYAAFGQSPMNFSDPMGLLRAIKEYFSARGGPLHQMDLIEGQPYAGGPTTAGQFTFAYCEQHVSAAWPMSRIKWGTPIRLHNDVPEFLSNGKWVSIAEKIRTPQLFVTNQEVKDFLMQMNRSGYHDARFPSTWAWNDFGHITCKYYKDKNKNGIQDPGESIEGDMLHPTPDFESPYGHPPDERLTESHGCIHVFPYDIDQMIKSKYTAAGSKMIVHPYSESFEEYQAREKLGNDPNATVPYEVHFFPRDEMIIVTGEKTGGK